MNNGGLQETTPPDVPGYRVGRKLGRGSSADVWLVEAPETGRRFAVKCFHPQPRMQEETAVGGAEEDVRREIRILSVLNHEHLVKVHDVVRLAGGDGLQLGILLDLAAGGSLAQLVETRARLTVGETVTVLTPLAQALAYLHAKGFTHGDVSPGNVLFSAEGKPLLTDVGIARMVGDPAGPLGGTPGFCDPAPVDSIRAGLQPERDLYSLAAVGWYCLTGNVPPATRDRPPLPLIHPEVPAALATALESGLNEDRRQRPTAAEFATAVYRSAAPTAVGLSTSVHPSVIPELLTRRRLPDVAPDSLRGKVLTWRRHLTGLPAHKNEKPLRPSNTPVITGTVAVLSVGLAAAAVLWSPGPVAETVPQGGATQAGNSSPAVAGGTDSAEGIGQDTVTIPTEVEVQLGSSDPALAVLGLAWLRSEAFRKGKPELLDQVNVAGSAAQAADAAIMTGLQESGRVLAGFSLQLRAITVEAGGSADRSLVDVESSTTSYQERTTAGEQLAERAGAPAERLQLVLERDNGRWRISAVLDG